MLLVLDLDETLIHASDEPLERPHDFRVGPFYIYKRPYLKDFLAFVFEHFDVAVWTSSSPLYAAELCEQLFSPAQELVFLWSSERCTLCIDHNKQSQYWVKDFKKLRRKGFCLKQVLVIDDTPEKHERNYGNLIRASAFTGAADDTELLALIDYLKELKDAPNVRTIDKRGWRSRSLVNTEPTHTTSS